MQILSFCNFFVLIEVLLVGTSSPVPQHLYLFSSDSFTVTSEVSVIFFFDYIVIDVAVVLRTTYLRDVEFAE